MTAKPHNGQGCEAFTVIPCVRETLEVGSNIIDIMSMQEIYAHLAVLDLVSYSSGDIETTPGQDVYFGIGPVEYFAVDKESVVSGPGRVLSQSVSKRILNSITKFFSGQVLV